MWTALANRDIRRLEIAWALAWIAIWGWLAALGVWVFEEAGTTAVSLVLLARMGTGALTVPILGAWADRTNRVHVLRFAAGAEVVLLVVAMVLIQLEMSWWELIPVVAAEGAASAAILPAHRGLTPWLATEPRELAGANALTEAIVVVSLVAGPALAGIVLAFRGPGVAVGAFALFQAATWLVLRTVQAPVPHTAREDGIETSARLKEGFAAFRGDAGLVLTATLVFAAAVFLGLANVYANPVAFDLLGLGEYGPPVLLAIVGVGALIGGVVAPNLVSRAHVSTVITIGLVIFCGAALAIGAKPTLVVVLTALLATGIGTVWVDVSTTLIAQRLAPLDRFGAVLGLIAVLSFAGTGAGVMLGSGLAAAVGVRSGLVIAACAFAVLVVGAHPALRRLNRRFPDLTRQVAALRSVPAFDHLPVPVAEMLAREMGRAKYESGQTILQEGDTGNVFYILEYGSVVATRNGREVNVMYAPDSFGEIALLHDVTRTATVTTTTPVITWCVSRKAFLSALTADQLTADEVEAIATTRGAK